MTLIAQLNELPDHFDLLVTESQSENFNFLYKMRQEWDSGTNNFSKKGEIVFGAFHQGLLVGVCGLNIDPYADNEMVGRIRHLYVSAPYRCTGLGSQLVNNCLQYGKNIFCTIRLRAANSNTDQFYQDIGFLKITENSASHVIRMN